MCHTCLFVKLDSDGVDIDGCLKSEIIEELRAEGTFTIQEDKDTTITSRFSIKGQYVLNYEENHLDEKHCSEPFQFKSTPDYCPVRQENEAFCKARERAYQSYKQFLWDRMMRAEKLSLADVRRLYPVKDKVTAKYTAPTFLNQFPNQVAGLQTPVESVVVKNGEIKHEQ